MKKRRAKSDRHLEEFLGASGQRAFAAILKAAPDPKKWKHEERRWAIALAKILSMPPSQRTPLDLDLMESTPRLLELGPIDFAEKGNYKQNAALRERRAARAWLEKMFAANPLLAQPVDEFGWQRLVDRHIELHRRETK